MKKILFSLLIIILYSSCEEQPPVVDTTVSEKKHIQFVNDSILLEIRKTIQTGDILLRTGTDFSSDQIKEMCKIDKTYSHAGIVVAEKDSVFIYSIEPDYYYIKDKVRKESLDSFCNPSKNYGVGIGRYNLSPNEKISFLAYLEEQYQKKIPFDMLFGLETDDKMYCSEMIKKGLATSTNNRIVIKTDLLDDRSKYRIIKRYFKVEEKRFANMKVVMVDRLFLNPHCTMLKKFRFAGN